MDFLDPEKQRAHVIRLFVGYVLIGIAVLFATLVLLYQAYGFGLDKKGQVIQNGLVFVSSQPSPAQIYLNGRLNRSSTNTKLQLQAGQYLMNLRRDGYRSWQRLITVEGGSVQRIDYPLLVPEQMITTNVKTYTAAPGFASESPDRRWLLVHQQDTPLGFDLFDLADPKKVSAAATSFNLPDNIVTNPGSAAQSWSLVEWSTDNRHVLVQHGYTADNGMPATEYITIDRQDPSLSINLTRGLTLPPAVQLTLRDKKYDRFYVFDPTAHTLGTTAIADTGKITPLLDQVLVYKPYGPDMILYVTDKNAPAGQVLTMLKDGDSIYRVREHAAAPPYLIDMAQYSGDWYVAVGASGDNKVYIYKNPEQIRKSSETAVLVPQQILKTKGPSFLSFSSNTQFVMDENGTGFSVYDILNDKSYNFISKYPLDPPAAHATWMDGDRLTYVSDGKVIIFDYDYINAQVLVPASSRFLTFFDRDYRSVYTLTLPPATAANKNSAAAALTFSSLLIPADQ